MAVSQKYMNETVHTLSMLRKLAREYRDADSMVMLIKHLVEHPHPSARKLREAYSWINRTHSLSNQRGIAMLGCLAGLGIKGDSRQSYYSSIEAARYGVRAAQFNLSVLYRLGRGGVDERDDAKADYWLERCGGPGHLNMVFGASGVQLALIEGPGTVTDLSALLPGL